MKKTGNVPKEHDPKSDDFCGAPEQPPAKPMICFINPVLVIKNDNLHQVSESEDEDQCPDVDWNGHASQVLAAPK
jgi:hypothetical protein